MADLPQERYVRQRELGAGAMGAVWLATDTLLGRPVAIKYLTAPDNATHKEFFLSEARTLASLNHPSITLIYDAVFDEPNNQFYLVMEYVEGKPLGSLIEGWSGPLPLQVTLDVTLGVLEALQYAHNKGVVHRDIKPENVIIQKEGIKLTDFGLAGLMSIIADAGSYMVGTPAYMSPEQIEGMTVDGRADLYALGVMLFEMLSGGYKPFEQYTKLAELFDAHVKKLPPSLRKIAPDIPLAMERVVRRLLAKDPADRYPSATALTEVLSALRARQQFSQLHLNLLDLEIKPLVGRTKEIEQMTAIWDQGRTQARPHLLVVQGEMGIGKTSLVAEFLGHQIIDQGYMALMGRCDRSGTPYTPFAEILAAILSRDLSKSVGSEQVDLLLAHIPDLARLLDLPEALQEPVTPPVPAAEADDSHAQKARWRFFSTILHILRGLGPTVLFFEDADFLDENSVALTQFLIRRGQVPLLVIATCPKSPTPTWLQAFSVDETTTLELEPLDKKAIEAKLVDSIGGSVDEALVSLIRQRSQGNPLQIEETTRQLLDSKAMQRDEDGQWRYKKSRQATKTPLGVATRRLDNLTDLSQRALAIAALMEPMPEFDFDMWVTVLGGQAQLGLAQLTRDEALDKRLLRQIDENRLSFRPPHVAKKLVKELSRQERQALHRQLADLFQEKRKDPLLVAHHYEAAGDASQAAAYLEQVGAKAVANQALKVAIVYYKRAVMLVESASAYKALGQLYRREKKWINSLQSLQHALELAEEQEDVADQAEILNELSFTLWLYDDYEEAYEPAAAVLEMPDVAERQRALAHAHLSMIAWLMGRLAEAKAECQQAMAFLTASNDEAGLVDLSYRLGLIHLSQGQLTAADIDFQKSLGLSERLKAGEQRGYALAGLGRVATERGAFEEAGTLLDDAWQQFEAVDSTEGRLLVYRDGGQWWLVQHQPDDAIQQLTKALHIALKIGKRAYDLSHIYRLIAQASLVRGDVKLAYSAASDALKLVEAVGNQEPLALAQATLASIYAAQGDATAARSAYETALQILETIGSLGHRARTLHQYAHFLIQQGQADEAARLQQEAILAAGAIGLYL